jgi:hypothetical protein
MLVGLTLWDPALLAGGIGVLTQLALAGSGIALSVLIARALTGRAAWRASAWLGERTMEVYVAHMFLLELWAIALGLPLLPGALGTAVNVALVLASALALGWALGLTRFTAAAFLGRWKRTEPVLDES